jgi:hypothetical protein
VVGQGFGAGQGETLGQGVEHPAQLKAPQQRLELRGDLDRHGFGSGRGGAGGGADEGLRTLKSPLSRTNRLAVATVGAGVVGWSSRPRVSMRSIRPTLTA